MEDSSIVVLYSTRSTTVRSKDRSYGTSDDDDLHHTKKERKKRANFFAMKMRFGRSIRRPRCPPFLVDGYPTSSGSIHSLKRRNMELPTKVVLFMLTATTASIMSMSTTAGMQQQQQQQQRRRGGAKFLVEGKGRFDSLDDILSPHELQRLARIQAQRTPGSLKYQSNWRHVLQKSLDSIRYHLSQHLPYPADAETFEHLFFNLGTAADHGIMPSFADPGSRSGYALEFFCRARLLSDILLEKCNPGSKGYYFYNCNL